jgi:hypothetical protein
MERYCWLVLLAVFLALLGALWIFQQRQQRWILEDAFRIGEIEKLREAARVENEKTKKALEAAGEAQGQIILLEGELERIRKRTKSRPKPTTLPECEQQLVELQGHIDLLETTLALERTIEDNLDVALDHQTARADLLEKAWQAERKRSQALQRQAKREKVKKVFLAAGVVLAGGAMGYAIGTTR